MANLGYKNVQEISGEIELISNNENAQFQHLSHSATVISTKSPQASLETIPPARTNESESDHDHSEFHRALVKERLCDSLVVEMGLNEKIKNSDKGGADKEKKPKKGHRTPPPPGLKDDLTTIAHICVVLFVGLILYLCFSNPFEFFTWHPLLLSIGWMLLMTEGVLFISKENPLGRLLNLGRVLKVRYHWIALVISCVLVTIGFVVIVINKNERGKEHFKTLHAIFGLIAILGCIPALMNGTVCLFDVELKRYIKPALNTAIHVTSGTVVVIFGGLSLIMSVFTHWFQKKSNNNKYLWMLGLATATYVTVWTVQRPLRKTLRKLFKFENV